ncbi:MG284/MPN403 family protein [Mycoplasma sp. Ms02]|uniref:MG284/MPN403 family protein n=1 Tax=Mycoplasma sp. Ms02 TaxID=353851 RepID=UPI001C8AE8DC|nr:hypothetical protein [Mycoplasma sp. Ms02]QZE12592.1 hypothetical protein K4L35_01230 [Mycoplasma sp. Ms02]
MKTNSIDQKIANGKSELVKTICNLYKLNLKSIELEKKRKLLYAKDKESDTARTLPDKTEFVRSNKEKTSNTEFLKLVLKNMSKKEAWIIENTYINDEDNTTWYENYFSRSNFYKKRKEAVDQFLYLYFGI